MSVDSSELSHPTPPPERSLDPDDWEALRSLGHRVFDDMVDYLASVRERPAWKPLPAASKNLFAESVPTAPTPATDVYEQIREHVLPYSTGNIHPRFWSWVGGTGTADQLLADMVISAMNAGGLGFDEAASTYVELQLLDWLKSMLGYPASASGLLVSGGSMANLVGLAVARTRMAGYDVRETGVDTASRPRLVYYASSETHSCICKAVELLGLGRESLHRVPVGEDYRIDLDALQDAITSDRAAGHQPICLVANVGTVNTGAVDPIEAMNRIAREEKLWVHADGAFGAMARLSRSAAPLVAGLESVDSLAFDLHKWLYVQYDCGCALVRSRDAHRNTFSVVPDYLRNLDRGLAAGPLNFSEYGVQLSRSFRALRAWMALKIEGVPRYAAQIEQNVQQARYLRDLIEAEADLELLAPVPLNIVNFRYRAAGVADAELDDLNAEILMTLHERGIATPSSTTLQDRFAIRVAICNHRSRRADFAALVRAVLEIGRDLSGQ